MALRDLSDVLWRERQLLDLLVFRLATERNVDPAHLRWAAYAADDVDRESERLRLVEMERATVAAEEAQRLGLSPLSSLAELAAAAPEPWNVILDRHREALADLTDQVASGARESRARLRVDLAEVRREIDLRTEAGA
jgi:hypothetical protein